MKKNSLWACVIHNIINTACWIALAIVFNKWWIALFTVLFQLSVSNIKKYYRICDKCGKHSEYADSYNEALDKAKKAGWAHNIETNKDYCPECKG